MNPVAGQSTACSVEGADTGNSTVAGKANWRAASDWNADGNTRRNFTDDLLLFEKRLRGDWRCRQCRTRKRLANDIADAAGVMIMRNGWRIAVAIRVIIIDWGRITVRMSTCMPVLMRGLSRP